MRINATPLKKKQSPVPVKQKPLEPWETKIPADSLETMPQQANLCFYAGLANGC